MIIKEISVSKNLAPIVALVLSIPAGASAQMTGVRATPISAEAFGAAAMIGSALVPTAQLAQPLSALSLNAAAAPAPSLAAETAASPAAASADLVTSRVNPIPTQLQVGAANGAEGDGKTGALVFDGMKSVVAAPVPVAKKVGLPGGVYVFPNGQYGRFAPISWEGILALHVMHQHPNADGYLLLNRTGLSSSQLRSALVELLNYDPALISAVGHTIPLKVEDAAVYILGGRTSNTVEFLLNEADRAGFSK